MSRRISVGRISRMRDRVLGLDETISVFHIENKITELKAEFATYRSLLDNEIETMNQDDLEKEFHEVELNFENAMDHLVSLKSNLSSSIPNSSDSLHEFLQHQQKVLTTITENRSQTSSAPVLPKIQITPFSGNMNEWITFRDLFMSTVHNNMELDDIQKMQFLHSSVKDEAASLIRNIPISAANYPVAWNTLLESFNNESIVLNSILSRFVNCESVSPSQANLKKVANCFRETFEMLNNQGTYAKSRDPLAIFLMIQKLDSDSELAWVKHSRTINNPTVKQFLDFLRDRCSLGDLRLSREGSRSDHLSRQSRALKINSVAPFVCFHCSEPHSIYSCPKFEVLGVNAREKFISSQGRCFNCLGKGHSVKSCSSKKNCMKCQNRHNTLLHRDQKSRTTAETRNPSNKLTPETSVAREGSDPLVLNQIFSVCAFSSILPTAIIRVRTTSGRYKDVRALLDSGAQTTLITESLVSELGLSRSHSTSPLSTLMGTSQIHARGRVDVQFSSTVNQSVFSTTALILPDLPGLLPSNKIEISGIEQLKKQFLLADPYFNQPNRIDMLLAAPFLFSVLKPTLFFEKNNQLFIQASRLGYLVCSALESPSSNSVNHVSLDVDEHSDKLLQRFWEIEEVPMVAPILNSEDERCEELFRESFQRLNTGRFCVRLPFRHPSSELGRSFDAARRRFLSLERRLVSNARLYEEYRRFMLEYESSGHMKLAQVDASALQDHYYVTPHHGIWQCGLSGMKLRVVFDASMKSSSGYSLNDILFSGPSLQTEISDIIIQFRQHRFVLTSDIEKMYRQINIHAEDQCYQLILWRSHPSEDLRTYQLTTVTYGHRSSPFLALRCLVELSRWGATKFPRAAKILLNCRYVDDLLFGSDSITELKSIKNELVALLRCGEFNLKKWSSNHPDLIEDVVTSDLANPLIFSNGDIHSIRTLGICWEPKFDQFSYYHSPREVDAWSKRSLLSDTARLYDPLGWISPIVLRYKALFQETWAQHVDWDSTLPTDIVNRWKSLRSDLTHITSIKIPRYFGSSGVELHGFSDASKVAYSAAVYVRSIDSEGIVHSHLLMSKTKLAPIKPISIPRLELCGAQLLAKLVHRIKSTLKSPTKITLWSDSNTVLAWINSLPRKWNSFVCNRVSNINELCPNIPWRYVRSAENPADIASRGVSAAHLLNCELWWRGPKFLSSHETVETVMDGFETSEESASPAVMSVRQAPDFWNEILERYSEFNRLIRSLSYVFRFVDVLKRSRKFGSINLSYDEISRTKTFLVKRIQSNFFADEIARIEQHANLSSNSPLRRLSPFIDEQGLLRVGGRLQNSNLYYCQIHPILLPNCHFSALYVRNIHMETFHGGLTLMCTLIRKQFWIIQLQRTVKSVINSCTHCRRYRGETYQPQMGPLPKERFDISKAFSSTGVDFAGPINLRPYISRGNLTVKGFIAVFVCLATKAVHLELVMSLSTPSLLMAVRRFIARRGTCKKFLSDNGRNFVGASRAFREYHDILRSACKSAEVSSFLANQMSTWEFIPRYSPHFGGIWEAAVKSVKRHLFHAFHNSTITIEEFSTALCQIEAILNSRPLTPIVFSEPFHPITPSDLLTGNSSGYLTDDLHPCDETSSSRARWMAVSSMVSRFWHRWRNEYVSQFLKVSKWSKSSPGIRVNDIALIKKSSDPPRFWHFAKVIKLYPGGDGIVRVVDIQTLNGVHRESVRNLVPLLVDADASTGGSMFV